MSMPPGPCSSKGWTPFLTVFAVTVAVLCTSHGVLALDTVTGPSPYKGLVATSSCDISVRNISTKTASFHIYIGSDPWFSCEGCFFQLLPPAQWTSLHNHTLQITHVDASLSGVDAYGTYAHGWAFTVATAATTDPLLTLSMRVYNSSSSGTNGDLCGIVFGIEYLQALSNLTLAQIDQSISGWPAFHVDLPSDADWGSVTWANPTQGTEIDWPHAVFGRQLDAFCKSGGGIRGGPLAIFNQDQSIVAVWSPALNFMSSLLSHKNPSDLGPVDIASGLHGSLTDIPKGQYHETLLSVVQHTPGVTSAMMQWGKVLQNRFEKQPTDPATNIHYSHLSYYTDNGAVYGGGKPATNLTYEATIRALLAEWDETASPFSSFMYDAYWKVPGDWVLNTKVFPDGLAYMEGVLGMPTVLYMDAWGKSVYTSRYEFVCVDKSCIPVDIELWRFIFDQTKQWGGTLYENDFLITQFFDLAPLRQNISLARTWLMQMGVAAAEKSIDIQLCMPMPIYYLQSLEVSRMRSARVTNDYRETYQQWRIGQVSTLVWALGLLPFKDVFWTMQQPGNQYLNMTQVTPQVEALVSLHSMGPVGTGDGLGRSNVSLLLRTCRSDGLLLKPDRPMLPIDATYQPYLRTAPSPSSEIWTTFTTIDQFTWHMVFAASLTEAYSFKCSDLGQNACNLRGLILDHGASSIFDFSESHPFEIPACPTKNFDVDVEYFLYVLAPVIEGWTVWGELSKLNPISAMRIESITASRTSLLIMIKGAPQERVTFTVSAPGPGAAAAGTTVPAFASQSQTVDSLGVAAFKFNV
jgi:hypothetical protein